MNYIPVSPTARSFRIVLALGALCGQANAAVVVINDNQFTPGTWSATVLGGSAGSGTSASLSTQAGGAGQFGNAMTTTISSASNPFTFDVGLFKNRAWISSVDGLINSITFRMRHQSPSDAYYGEIRFAARQGNRVYVANGPPYVVQTYNSSWYEISRTLNLSDFNPAFGSTVPLDGSAGGGSIVFGFIDSRSDFTFGGPRYWRTAAWSMTATTSDVPAPGAIAVALLGLGAGGTCRRRRR
jgi:MYXO-CTERM domain-containing protein